MFAERRLRTDEFLQDAPVSSKSSLLVVGVEGGTGDGVLSKMLLILDRNDAPKLKRLLAGFFALFWGRTTFDVALDCIAERKEK